MSEPPVTSKLWELRNQQYTCQYLGCFGETFGDMKLDS